MCFGQECIKDYSESLPKCIVAKLLIFSHQGQIECFGQEYIKNYSE